MITAGHTMLKTTVLVIEVEELQHIAGNSSMELAELTVEISQIRPLTVARGIIDDKESKYRKFETRASVKEARISPFYQ